MRDCGNPPLNAEHGIMICGITEFRRNSVAERGMQNVEYHLKIERKVDVMWNVSNLRGII